MSLTIFAEFPHNQPPLADLLDLCEIICHHTTSERLFYAQLQNIIDSEMGYLKKMFSTIFGGNTNNDNRKPTFPFVATTTTTTTTTVKQNGENVDDNNPYEEQVSYRIPVTELAKYKITYENLIARGFTAKQLIENHLVNTPRDWAYLGITSMIQLIDIASISQLAEWYGPRRWKQFKKQLRIRHQWREPHTAEEGYVPFKRSSDKKTRQEYIIWDPVALLSVLTCVNDADLMALDTPLDKWLDLLQTVFQYIEYEIVYIPENENVDLAEILPSERIRKWFTKEEVERMNTLDASRVHKQQDTTPPPPSNKTRGNYFF